MTISTLSETRSYLKIRGANSCTVLLVPDEPNQRGAVQGEQQHDPDCTSSLYPQLCKECTTELLVVVVLLVVRYYYHTIITLAHVLVC